MIKVLFLIHDLGQGGAEKVLVNLVNNMDQSKFDITVMALFGGGVNEQFLKENIHYQVAFPKAFPGNSHIMKLLSPTYLHKFLIKDKYDIEVSYLEGPAARIVSGCPNMDTKLVSWIHGEQHSKEIAAKAFRSFKESEQCYYRFDNTICVSESVKKDFLSIYPRISNIDVLYNTNETAHILAQKEEAVEEDFVEDNSIKLCGVGKIVPIKGFDKLARIHKRLIDDGLNVHTYILGIGSEKDRIRKYLSDEGIEDTFTFLGYQTNPYKYVSKCDIFICSSIAEGFSTAATEALIVGTPVVTTPVAGMEEMLGSNNEYGIITEMNEDSLYRNIKELVVNSEKLKHYKKQAVIRGKYFSKDNTVAAVEEKLFSMVMKKR